MLKKCTLRFRKNYTLLIFSLMLAISFAALNIGTALITSSYKIDLTADNRYTLSKETVNWLQNNKEPLFIRLYLSPDIDSSYPALGQYTRYVVRFLEQYKNLSQNKINLEVIETKPYTNEENDAKRQGIRSLMDKSGQTALYFGAVISDERGGSYTIPYFEPQRRAYLEHDVSRILSKLPNYQKPVIGIISPLLDIAATGETFNNNQDWPFVERLRQDYDVEYIRRDKTQIPLRVKTLIVYNPQNLPNLTIYAIDQYLLRGGSVLMMLDPFSETFLNQKGFITSSPSGFQKFLANIGVEYDDNLVVGDISQSQNALITQNESSQLQNYPLWLDVSVPNINPNHPLTKNLIRLRMNSAGTFNVDGVGSANTTILFATSGRGGSVDADTAKYSTKSDVKEHYRQDDKVYPLAVLLEGKFPSYYSSHPLQNSTYRDTMFPFLATSIKPGRLLLAADSDMLAAYNWNRGAVFNGSGSYDLVPFNNNLDFIIRAADYLTDNQKILNVPPKGGFELQKSPEQTLNKETGASLADQIELYSLSMSQALYEQEQLKQKIKDQEVFPSVAVIKQMELLQREAMSNQEKLKAAEYQLREQVNSRMRMIIIVNTLVFPLLLLFAIWSVNYVLRLRIRRQAERYIND